MHPNDAWDHDQPESIEDMKLRLEQIELSMAFVRENLARVLEEMQRFLCQRTGLSREELSPLLDQIEEMAGPDTALTLSLEDIADLAKTLYQVQKL